MGGASTSTDPIRPRTIDALVDLGFSSEDAASRERLLAQAASGFRAAVGHDPADAWFVPGRIEIFGKHTDYAGGRSLVAAVPRGFAVVSARRVDRRVRVLDARYGGSIEIDPADETPRFDGWRRYVAVVVRRLAKNFPGADLGADLAIASDLPRAAGVSSSSALVVAIATALIECAGLEDRREWREAIATIEDLAGYLGAAENGLTFGPLSGTSGVGTHGGSEDHTAILAARAGSVSLYSYVPVVLQRRVMMPPGWAFIVAASGVEADKAGGARDRYNRASLCARAVLDVWNAARDPRATLSAVTSAGPEVIEDLRSLITAAAPSVFSRDDLLRRLDHFVAEDARCPAAASAFAAADPASLGSLARASQDDADRRLGNQIPETQTLARLAYDAGAFAASSFGAGFGGSVWALAGVDDAPAMAERWLSLYRPRGGSASQAASFIARPSPGRIRIPFAT